MFYPSENEGDLSTARSIQKNTINGTIWNMCFVSRDPSEPSKGHYPVLAILLNKYEKYELSLKSFLLNLLMFY